MEAYITSIDEILTDDSVIDLLYDKLHVVAVKDDFSEDLRDNLCTLRPELKVIVETEYVDRVYRNSFYRFFSTKLKPYYRNCIRLSFFEPEFDSIDAFMAAKTSDLRSWYNGFLVIRPLPFAYIGYNAIAKRAKLNKGYKYEICQTPIIATCMGEKLSVRAFPHSSQDGEYLSCAETAIWTMLEYFGNKYPIYRPALPTEVVDSLDSSAFERTTPTAGLTFQQLSLALKKNGLSTKVYYENNYTLDPGKFQEIFNCYVESGFPLAVCLTSNKGGGHAVVCVGRNEITPATLPTIKPIFAGQNNYVFWNRHNNNIILIDDNYPCYQSAPFNLPTEYYSDPNFQGMHISHFIVPLYSKIYLPAEIAIDASNYLVANLVNAPNGSCVKTFLTSSRSYRKYILRNPDFTSVQKQAYLQIEMPKFVWVTEISTFDQLSRNKINSVILLDATGNKSSYVDLSQLIFMQIAGNGHIFNQSKCVFEKFSLPLQLEFMAFKGNLE